MTSRERFKGQKAPQQIKIYVYIALWDCLMTNVNRANSVRSIGLNVALDDSINRESIAFLKTYLLYHK